MVRIKLLLFITLLFSCTLQSCNQLSFGNPSTPSPAAGLINETGTTIASRFDPPDGFKRTNVEANSFAAYLRNLPLKPHGEKVMYYNGTPKNKDVYIAVVDMPINQKNLQHCADAIMRLKGEFLYARKEYNKISFHFTNGFKADYTEWMQGKRIVVKGNDVSWKASATPSNTYDEFRKYMDIVFTYAGTLSLEKELSAKSVNGITIGDVFIIGGSPGHAMIVADMAVNDKGEKVFILAQGYMDAQETQIVKNPNDSNLSPWYSANFGDKLQTAEWLFTANQLKTWKE